MKKRFLVLIALMGICAATCYYYFKPNPQKQLEKVISLAVQGQLDEAISSLNSISSLTPSYLRHLYTGYLEQWRGCSTLSEQKLQSAYLEAKKIGSHAGMQEILLVRAANAYLNRCEPEFYSCLESAHDFSTDHAGLFFFEGLNSYMQQNYAEALHFWENYNPADVSEWMALSIKNLFPLKLYIAHCLIEKGEIFAGREILEKEALTKEIPFVNLLLGLSYLKEAQKHTLDQRGTFYTMTRFYFERARPDQHREKNQMIAYLEREAQELMARLNPLSFDCVHVLEQWQAHAALTNLADFLSAQILQQDEALSFCGLIRDEFAGTFFYKQLSDRVVAKVAQTLSQGDTGDIFEMWSVIESLHPHPKLAAREIASLTSEEIFETIKKDTLFLTHTRNYVAFWESLGRNSSEKELLAKMILFNAKLFWQNETQEKKGLQLMDLALALSNNDRAIEKEIAIFLTHLYTQAESSNMIHRLTLVYDAMVHFDINRQELISKAPLANHLADAAYLYHVHNYPQAQTHAGWVLKLDPHNEEARRLIGLCSFNLGEYDKAFGYLSGLKNPDADSQKAMMLSQVFAAQHQSRHLCQSDNLDSIADES